MTLYFPPAANVVHVALTVKSDKPERRDEEVYRAKWSPSSQTALGNIWDSRWLVVINLDY